MLGAAFSSDWEHALNDQNWFINACAEQPKTVQKYSSVSGDLWTFRDLDFSRVVLSRPIIGPFATGYFSHLFDPSRFATSVIFHVSRFAAN